MKRFLVIAVIAALQLASCTDRDDDLEAINIRIKNNSSVLFEEVAVGATEELHMNVSPGEYSTYFEYDEAYSYAFIQITSGEETYTLQPIDFVGEEILPLGFYTYELNISETGDVILKFVVD